MSNINEKLDRLRNLIQDQDFLTGKGLSNEVNIRMFCYEPKDEMAVRHFTKQLENDNSLECNLIVIIFIMCFWKYVRKNIIKKIPDMEEKKEATTLKIGY